MSNKKCQTKYIDCENCTMESVCLPVKTAKQSLNISDSYLTKRLPNQANEILFKENSTLTNIYAVTSGIFKLCKIGASGQENIIGLRFPGELIGEDALFLKKYNYTAIATTQSSACKVTVEQMASCGDIIPEVQQNFISLLTKQSYLAQQNVQAYIGKKSSESMLAAFLLNVVARNTHQTTHAIELAISRNDVANYLGLRRETLSRLFSKFQKEQFIQTQGKLIHIINQKALTQLADL